MSFLLANCGEVSVDEAIVETDPTLVPGKFQTAFPTLTYPSGTPPTAAQIALGKALFFDPVLSAENNLSCAHCHHPERGFSDGLPTATRRSICCGRSSRNTPTLWNSGYTRLLNWDGTVSSLEEQVLLPLTHPAEMSADIPTTLLEIAALPAYVDLFQAAFETPVTLTGLQAAIAAFERTLISDNAPYDQFIQGEHSALTAQEQRGLTLFKAQKTHCADCHPPPTFAQETFRVTGVPSNDLGRAAVHPNGVKGAFRVPTLRNVALTAPYMHNGSLATLEDVVQFYADGGGRTYANTAIDPLISGFILTAEEKSDLVAFLSALTDESRRPTLPAQTISGFAPIQHEATGRQEENE